MRVDTSHARYASLEHFDRGEPMSPRELVADALHRMTDGTLTFDIQEDRHTVAAHTSLDGRHATQGLSRALLETDPSIADWGVTRLLAQLNEAQR